MAFVKTCSSPSCYLGALRSTESPLLPGDGAECEPMHRHRRAAACPDQSKSNQKEERPPCISARRLLHQPPRLSGTRQSSRSSESPCEPFLHRPRAESARSWPTLESV